jgi:hypothetical protein
VLLSQLTLFQGDVKKRTDADIEALATSLRDEGLCMPFAVWQKDDTLYILDGHGRYAALTRLALTDVTILEQQYPAIMINADTEDEARKTLLQIISVYGKINKAGVMKFAAPLTNYTAPVIKHQRVMVQAPVQTENVVIKIKCKKETAAKLMDLLSAVEGVEIL